MSNEPIFMSLCFEQMPPSLYAEKVVDPGLPAGTYASLFEFPVSLGNFSSTGVAANDQFPSVQDGAPVVRTYDNFIINAGHTVTPALRCKGLYLNILGDLTVNGILSMTARGANAAGQYVVIDKNGKRIYYCNTLPGGVDYSKLTVINKAGGGISGRYQPGTAGINGACAGGGGGSWSDRGGQGGAGTSFSGGTGGGGGMTVNSYGGNGAANGGAGGAGVCNSGAGAFAGGGAGNPGGKGAVQSATVTAANYGANGTGGLMILFVHGNIFFGTNGFIQSNGSKGGDGSRPGGGSGGGAVHLFHKGTIAAPSKVRALGGVGGSNNTSCSGGTGTVNIVQI